MASNRNPKNEALKGGNLSGGTALEGGQKGAPGPTLGRSGSGKEYSGGALDLDVPAGNSGRKSPPKNGKSIRGI